MKPVSFPRWARWLALAAVGLWGGGLLATAQPLKYWNLLGAEEGRIYAVTEQGRVFFHWYEAQDGGTVWRNLDGSAISDDHFLRPWCMSDPRKIHLIEHVATDRRGGFYIAQRNGQLRYLRDQSQLGERDWQPAVPVESGEVGIPLAGPVVDWGEFIWVLADGDGRLYAIDAQGEMRFFRHRFADDTLEGGGVGIKSGWDQYRRVFAGGEGVIYAIGHDGKLFHFKDLARDGTILWENDGTPVEIGFGWDRFHHVFSTGDGRIYGVEADGRMFFYHVTVAGTTPTWLIGGAHINPGKTFVPITETNVYCWPLSAAPGEAIDFFLSGPGPARVSFFRHRSTGLEAESIPTGTTRTVMTQFQPLRDDPAHYGCGWTPSLWFVVPAEWQSGIYSALCEFADGSSRRIGFVIKPGVVGRSSVAVLANVNTWLAYNSFGRGKYAIDRRSHCSFLRPNTNASPVDGLPHLARGELWVLGWLEREGYTPDVYSDIDFHKGLVDPQAQCLILSTHPEYWTPRMYDRLQEYLEGGGTLLYLGGNGLFEQAEYSCDGSAMKFRVGIEHGARDPALFRWKDRGRRAELKVLGVASEDCGRGASAAFKVLRPRHWLFGETGLGLHGEFGTSGYNFGDPTDLCLYVPGGKAAGYEVDSRSGPGARGLLQCGVDEMPTEHWEPNFPFPERIRVLARAQPGSVPLDCGAAGYQWTCEMTYYDHPGGGFVLSIGSITVGGSMVKDEGLSRIVKNALERCLRDRPRAGKLLVNGSFEDPGLCEDYALLPSNSSYLTGWRVDGGSIGYHRGLGAAAGLPEAGGTPAHGDYAVNLASRFRAGGLLQSFPTEVGKTYVLRFAQGTFQDLPPGRTGRSRIRVSVAGVGRQYEVVNEASSVNWTYQRLAFVARSTTTTLRLSSPDRADEHFSGVDDVSVVECLEQPNLLGNGSFEAPGLLSVAPGFEEGHAALPAGTARLNGWTVSGGGVDYFAESSAPADSAVSSGTVYEGTCAVDLAGPDGPGGVETTIPTVSGARYMVAFAMGSSREGARNGQANIELTVTGHPPRPFTFDAGGPIAAWTRYQFDFIASGPWTTLRFSTSDDPATHFVLLDDVRVVECQPAELAIPIVGGTPSETIGDAITESRADGSLLLRGVSGLYGIRPTSGSTKSIRVDFESALDADAVGQGGEFSVGALGEGGAGLAEVRLVVFPPFAVFEVRPDFLPLGSETYNVRFYRGGTLVHESVGRRVPPPGEFPISDQVFSVSQPRTLRVSVRPGAGLEFEHEFPPNTSFSVYDAGVALNLAADRMVIFADPAGAVGPDWITGLELHFGGITERVISGLAFEKFGQEIRGGPRAVLFADADGLLALRTQPEPSPVPTAFVVPTANWDRQNPPGWYGNWDLGNPARFTGAGITDLAPLVQVDLTDVPAVALLRRGYRAGKSAVVLTAIPTMPDNSRVRWNVGGVLESAPGAPSVTLGALTFLREGDRISVSADPYPSTQPLADRLEIRTIDGQSRRYEGVPAELRVSTDFPATSRSNLWTAAINAAGHLLLGIAVPEGEPAWSVGTPDGQTASAVALTWELRLDRPLAPGSLRGLEVAGSGGTSVRLVDLTTSSVNPTQTTYFGGRRVQPLGHVAFAHDLFGNLELRGLSSSGQDGVAIEFAPGGPLRLELGNVTGSSFRYFPSPPGAVLNFRLVDKANAALPFAVLHGAEPCGGGQFGFGARFPGLEATTLDLRLSLAGQTVLTRPDRPVTGEGECGPVIVENPSSVSVEVIEGRFAWVLQWNRTALATLAQEGGPYRVDRVELIAAAPLDQPYPSTLEFRASHLGNWRLPAIVDRALPAISELAFKYDAGGLLLDWDKVATGLPRLEVAPEITGPWQAVGLGQALGSGRREARIATSGERNFIRLREPGVGDGCLEFYAQEPGPKPNPWLVEDWTITRYDRTGALPTENTIATVDLDRPPGTKGLVTDDRMELELPVPSDELYVSIRSLGNAVTFVALDEDGGEIQRKVVAAFASIFHFNIGGRPIHRLRIEGSGQPVLLLSLCIGSLGSQAPKDKDTPACLSWRGDQPGSVDNPWRQPGVTVTSVDASGALIPEARTRISEYGGSGLVGYEVEHQTTLEFDEACPWVAIEFVSGSGDITFEAYPVGGGEPLVQRLVRVTDVGGETVEFTSESRPIQRVVITTPGNLTRILKVCGGPIPRWFCRESATAVAPPLRNPQPVGGDTLWTFYNPEGGLGTSALRTVEGETGLELTRETDIEFFAADQRRVEFQIVVEEPGATLSAVATMVGGAPFAELPETAFPPGFHTVVLDNPCAPGDCGATLHRVRLKLLLGKVIVTRLCTPFGED